MAQSPVMPRPTARSGYPVRLALLAGVAGAALLGPLPAVGQSTPPATPVAAEAQVARGAQQSLSRARAAQARGDFRTAQIEYRNAVRADPASGYLRYALSALSLEMNDTDTAEKEARAAIERGFDPAGATGLLLRSYLARGRHRDLLRDFPIPTDAATPTAVAGQIAAARTLASLANGDPAAARVELAEAMRLAPDAAATSLAAASVAGVEGDRAALGQAIERALAAEPNNPEALLRKAGLQLQQGQRDDAMATLDRLIRQAPNLAPARLLRGELRLRAGDAAAAKEDVDAALRVAPGSVAGIFLRAALQARAQDWRAADETLGRLGANLANLPDGLLLQATVKRGLGQTEQALDVAQRYVSRRPEDPRGAKLLATMELEARQPAAAVGTLERLAQRGGADLESNEMLSRALLATGRSREAAAVVEKLVAQVPNNPALRMRLAVARLAAGDTAGTLEAAREAMRIAPATSGARELVVVASLARGDIATAEAELGQLSPEARRSELAGIAEASLRVAKLDVAGGRAGFEDVLKRYPESIGARLGLARISARSGEAEMALRLWTEVLQREPARNDALAGIAGLVLSGGPLSAPALAALEAANAAAQGAPVPALTLATVLIRSGQAERALAILDTDAVRTGPLQRGALAHLLRADALAALDRWPEVEAATRTAFADDPANPLTRRALALATARNGDVRGAEELLRAGLRQRSGDALLQQTLVGLVNQSRGIDAALAVADEIARQPGAMPAALPLRGDLLVSVRRPADAAAAYASAYATAPSALLAQRTAAAWQAAGDLGRAAAAIEAWLERNPSDVAAESQLSQVELLAGREEAAAQRLARVVERAPTDATALNNLAWVLAQHGGPDTLARARNLAERAYFLAPTAESADTLGWVLVKSGEPAKALPLLREAVAARRIGSQPSGGAAPESPDPAMSYRLAFALNAVGEKAEALKVLEPILAANPSFDERAEAERLLGTLRGGR